MSIRPVDFNGMMPKKREMGIMKRKNGRKKTRSSKRLTMFI